MVSWNVGFRLPGGKEHLSGSAPTERQAVEMLVSESRQRMRQLGIDSHRGVAVFFIDSIQGDLQELNDTNYSEEYVVNQITSMINRSGITQKYRNEQISVENFGSKKDSPDQSTAVNPPPVTVSMSLINEWLLKNGLDTFSYVPLDMEYVDLYGLPEEYTWPNDLIEFFNYSIPVEIELLPGFVKLDLNRSIEISKMWINIEQDSPYIDWDEISATSDVEAGVRSEVFLNQFVSIFDGSGETLVVDLRAGSRKGCVLCYSGENGISNKLAWPSLAALLSEIVHSLESGEPFRDSYTADVGDGTLRWNRAPAS